MLIRFFLLLSLLLQFQSVFAIPGKVAITIDDLPFVNGSSLSAKEEFKQFHAVLSTLKKFNIKAMMFVIGSHVKKRHIPLLNALLEEGHLIGNHTFSHKSLNDLSSQQYKDDILRNHHLLQQLKLIDKFYFRYPMLHHGNTPTKKQDVINFLKYRQFINVPVSIDNDDWMFNQQLEKALAISDDGLVDEIKIKYLNHMITETKRNQDYVFSNLGRDIKHILLLHMNQINARYLDQLLTWYQEEGWTFISTEEALSDPIYSMKDCYVGPWGWSWSRKIYPMIISRY